MLDETFVSQSITGSQFLIVCIINQIITIYKRGGCKIVKAYINNKTVNILSFIVDIININQIESSLSQ